MNIGVFEEDYSSECGSISPKFAIPKKNGAVTIRVVTDVRNDSTQLIVETYKSPTSYSKD
jgi:hypothetical protein